MSGEIKVEIERMGDGTDDGLSLLMQQISNIVINNLDYPWRNVEDTKPTDLEYELFCGALESFWSKSLIELVDDWTISLETVLPTIRSSIRMYSKASSKEKVSEMDLELARWVEFGLSSSRPESYAKNSRVVMVGCSLVKELSAMHEKQLSVAFSELHYMHYIMDIILSSQFCRTVRCEAAEALLHILFHPSISCECMLIEGEEERCTSYEQIIRLLIRPEGVPLDLLALLQKIIEYFAFKYSIDIIVKYARKLFVEDSDIDICQLLSSFSITEKFFAKIKNDFSYESRIAHQTIVKNRIIPHICAVATSPSQNTTVRHLAVECLRTLCDFNGTEISGAIFLSHMDSQTISLVGRLLQRFSDNNKKASLLPHALRAIVLIDQMAAANGKCDFVVDAPEHVIVLQNMLKMMSVDEGRLALISTLSFGDNLKILLHACDIQKSCILLGNYPDEDSKMRFRQSATYGYMCEILFALARYQSDGFFWRKHGFEINKLIDSNIISAATSLKQWLEPLREELAIGTTMSTLNFLLLRLVHHSEKYVEGDPPLQLVTLLRLIDAILDEAAILSDVSSDEIRYGYCTRFYEGDGLDSITNMLNVANDEQSKRVHVGCTSLSGDSNIYCQFVRSATSILYKLLSSLQILNQKPDKATVDTLLRTYTLCCVDDKCCDRKVENYIFKSFALFLTPPTSVRRQRIPTISQRSFLELFIDSGFEKPSNFFAVLNILRQSVPLPSADLTTVFEKKKTNLVEIMWRNEITRCEQRLQLAILLGIASSERLRHCLLDLCIRLAYLSEKTASCIANILIKQSLQMLTSSTQTAIVDAFEEKVVQTDEPNVRFGTAADIIKASFYAFMEVCSTNVVLRNSMINVIAHRKNYIPTLLKFFKLASPKTAPHVAFQTHVIKFFRNLCIFDDETDAIIDYLSPEVYFMICKNLVEHIGNAEHDVETVLLALRSICDIGNFSKFGNDVICKSFIDNEGAVLHLLDRFNLMSEINEKSFLEAAAFLADLFENVLRKESMKCAVLKFPSSADSGEHPLLRLKHKLVELGCSEQVLRSLQKAIEVTYDVEDHAKPVDLEPYIWSENTAFVQVKNHHALNYRKLLSLKIDHRLFRYRAAPLLRVDLNALNEEFFSGIGLIQKKESVSSLRQQNLNPIITKIQRWKTPGFDEAKRKRSYGAMKMRLPVVRPKIRRY